MRGEGIRFMLAGLLTAMLVGCSSRPVDRGQQYIDGKLNQPLALVNQPAASGQPVNAGDFSRQLTQIKLAAPRMYERQQTTYGAITSWLTAGGDTRELSHFGLNAYQMRGVDNYGNVQFTGYYTPNLQARYTRQGEFMYPLYRMPAGKKKRLPTRAEIYRGALKKGDIIGYSNSMMDNFIMSVQGSGYVDFGDGRPPRFFAYGGKNGHPYRSIGKVLIDQGVYRPEEMSMQAIRQWGKRHNLTQVRKLLEKNPSFVFFKPQPFTPVCGASAVPLIARASVAADSTLIPPGTALLAEIPLLDNTGKFNGKYEMPVMVSLDVGGAIKDQHLDIYQGTGPDAAHLAGWYNHYGRVWVLRAAPGTGLYTERKTAGEGLLVSR